MAIPRGTGKRQDVHDVSTAKQKPKEKAKANVMGKEKQKLTKEAEGSLDDDDEIEIVAEHFATTRGRGRGRGKRKPDAASTAKESSTLKQKDNVAPKKKQKVRKEREGSIETSFFFPTIARARTYKEKFEKKEIFKCRSLKLDDFMEFDFGMWLKLCGMQTFVSVEEIIYPRLVRMFYCNITDGDNCNDADPNTFIKTYVKGVEIPVSPAMLREVFGMVYFPDMHTMNVTKKEIFPILSKSQCVEADLKKMPSKNLRTMNMRLFHYMIVYNLFPRAGSYTAVTGGDALLLYAQAQGEDFNFPIRLIVHMLRCRYRKRTPLLYGMAITKILKHYGVDLSGEEEMTYKKADTIDINVMARLGYVFSEDENAWVEKQVTQQFARDDDGNQEDGQNDDRDEDESGHGEHHHLPSSSIQFDKTPAPSSIQFDMTPTPSSPTFRPTPTWTGSPTLAPTPIEDVATNSPTPMPTPTEQVAPNTPTSMPTPTEVVTPFSGFTQAKANVSSFALSYLMDSMEKLKSSMEHFISRMDTRMDGFERQLSHLQATLDSRNGGASTSKGGDS